MDNKINISEYASNSYLEYAMSVVKGRAIPSVQDGCKPVHRRSIYSMYSMGITDVSIPKKSARITGDIIGKYHPHGDMAVYEAMVNQTQTFRMRYPIIFGEGNFGSRDGDSAAAQRYTECKFYPITRLLYEELNEGAVDFIPNYDGNEKEPEVLPARLPFILLNVSEGIGVGMATNIPSHNLKEVVSAVIAYVENPKITTEEIMNHIKGPDFPTGCEIITSKEEMLKVYNEGRGAFRMRAKYYIENPGTKNWKLIFNEIPFGVSAKTIVEEIDNRFNPENNSKKDAKGKEKKISPEQARIKQLFINLIDKYMNESDKNDPMRIAITPKSHKQDPEELVSVLLGTTSLETNFNANFVVVGLDGRPVQKNLLKIIGEWTTFRLTTIDRRCKFHLEKIAHRLHILDGRKTILHHIDEVIKIVKESMDPKTDLMNKYSLSEIQAQDVLDLKLRQLGNLELASIEKEYSGLVSKQNELQKIIATEKSLKKQMVKELQIDLEKFSDERVSEIKEGKKVDLTLLQEKSAKVAEEPITLAISEKNWVKTFKGIKEANEISFKEGDKISEYFYCKNTDTLCLFDVDGKVYNYPLNELNKDGLPINTLVQMSSKLSLACPINKDFKYVLANNAGYGFIVSGENLMTRVKAGKEMFKVDETKQILQPLYFANSEAVDDYYIGIITTENRFLTYKLSEISEISKGKGVTICGLTKDYKIKEITLIKDKDVKFNLLSTKNKTSEYVLLEKDFVSYVKGRSTKGAFLPIKDKMSEISFNKQ